MTASAFSYSWATIGHLLYITKCAVIGTLIRVKPLRSPMSIFSKSTDLEKCEAGVEV